jgi:hypothetical protein
MHPNHLKRAIIRTQKQITKQKNKQLHSKDDKDKEIASNELDRLREKMINLQYESNKLRK